MSAYDMERGRADFQRLKQLAAGVFASMDGLSPSTLRTLAFALSLAREPGLAQFSTAIDYHASGIEADRRSFPPGLAVIKLAGDLAQVARQPDLDELLGRLKGADTQPWPALGDALEQARELVCAS